jgi:hypothetical protein
MDFIYSRDNALPDDLCDELIRRFEDHPDKRPGPTGSGVDPTRKLSLDITIDQIESFRESGQRLVDQTLGHFADYFLTYPFFGSVNPVLKHRETGVETTITFENVASIDHDLMKMIVPNYFRIGPLNILKYRAGEGGYRHWHAEIFPDAQCESLHRLLFFIYYLNDVDAGGETEFLFQDVKIQPKKARLVIAPAGFTHTHRGNVPQSGDKYILSSWLLFKRAGKPSA